MIRILVHLLCLFVPVRAWRKAIRQRLVEQISRPRRMKRFHKIADWRVEKVDGVKVAVGVLPNGATIRLGHVFGKDISTAYGAHEIFYSNEYHFSAQGKAVVIDIGMNNGYASLYFALRDDVEAVYAFEPVKAIYERALFSISLNKCGKKITAYNYGLGERDKEITINFDPAGSGTTSTDAEHQVGGTSILTVQVKDAAVAIRNIIAKHPGKKIIIKCDCEGAEKEIFARLDAENILPSLDTIVMEYHNRYDNFIEPLLEKYGFAYFKSMTNPQLGIIRAMRTQSTR